MNASQRKAIEALKTKLEEIRDDVETFASEEQEKFDNMPEGLQQGEAGEKIQQSADNIETAISDLETACE